MSVQRGAEASQVQLTINCELYCRHKFLLLKFLNKFFNLEVFFFFFFFLHCATNCAERKKFFFFFFFFCRLSHCRSHKKMMTDCLVTFTEDDLMMYNDEIMMPCMTTCDSSMVAPAICEACGIASAVASVCATGTHVYCSDACRLVDGPRHAAVCLAPLAGVVVEQKCEFLLETEFLGASQPAPQSLAQWMQQANSLTANKDVVSNVDGKRRRLSADDDAPQQPAQLLLDDVFHNANPLMFFPHELLLAPQPPVLLVAASSPESSTICCSVESPLNTSGFSLVSDDDDDAGAAELIEPRLAQQPRRARSETAAKKHKRNEYAQLDDAERAKLRELGVPTSTRSPSSLRRSSTRSSTCTRVASTSLSGSPTRRSFR
jgi:hypothetical protein